MRRILMLAGLVLGQAVLFMASAAAQSDLLFGQQHSYSVTMRGNAEAVVTARIMFTNTGDQPQTSFAFTIPGSSVDDLVGYQQQVPATCLSYGTLKPTDQPLAVGSTVTGISRPCERYAQPDYSGYPYTSIGSTYSKLKPKAEAGGKYVVDLPTPVKSQESSALLLGYSAKGYAKNVLGAYAFNFPTIKVSDRIKVATVAVDVDSDLYLLRGGSKVNYGQSTGKAMPALGAQEDSAVGSKTLDTIAYATGQGGQINKQTHDLAASESFVVSGTYADAVWKLHPWRLGLLVLLGLGLLALAGYLLQRMRKTRSAAAGWPAFFEPVFVLSGMASSFTVGLLTWGAVYYSQQAQTSLDMFTSVVVAVICVLVYAVVIVGPVVGLAVHRRDVRVAAYVFGWQLIWLVVLLLVYLVGIRPFMPSPSDGVISPMDVAPSIKAN